MRVLLAGDRPHDRDYGRRAALGVGYECSATDCVPLADLRLRMACDPDVHLVVVFVDPDPAAAAGAISSAAGDGHPIYAATADDSAATREAVGAAGVAGLWPVAGLRENLLEAADAIRRKGKAPARRGRVVAVTAALPGSGVTTVATGLAFALAGPAPVLLAELGAGTPELALDLDLTPQHSLAELLRAGDRMDARMVRDAAVRHEAGPDVLAYQPETPPVEPVTAAAARTLQILLRGVFDWSVIDAGHPTAAGPNELLRHADAVILVARLDPPGLRLTRQYAKALAAAGVSADAISVVGNRYGQPRQVPWQSAQDALKATVRAWLPDDPRSVNRALADGQPLVRVARGAKITRELAKLAAALRTQFAPAAR